MVFAEYPFLDVFWTMCIFFVWVAWFMLLFRVIADVFRRHDIGGGGKVLWLVFVIAVPFLGVFVYLLAQSGGMAERSMRQVEAR
jgi:phospholipase D-like protein